MKGKAIAGLVLSIVAIVFGFLGPLFSVIALPMAIVGLVLSAIAGKQLKANNQPAGIATAGLVLGIIATVLTAIFFFTCGICYICAAATDGDALEDAFNDALNQISY